MKPKMPEYKPCLYIELGKEDLEMLRTLKVGKNATFKITGKVVGMRSSESQDLGGKPQVRGTIDLQDYDVECKECGDFDDMMEDEE